MPNMVARQFLSQYSLTASNSITFPKQSGSPAAVVNRVAEGADFPMDVTAYSSVNVVPYKVAHGFIITRETIEDSLIPIQQDQLARASLRVANKVDKDCIDVIDTGRSGSTAATGKSLATNGTEFVLSGSGGLGIGMYDIIAAKALVENNNYVPDSILIHPRAKVFIERLPHFTAQYSYGEPKMKEGWIATPGQFGTILGLDAFCSTNCGTGSAYVLSRGKTPNIMGQYKGVGYNSKLLTESPLGFFVETSRALKIHEGKGQGVYFHKHMYGKSNPKYGKNKGEDNPMYGRPAWNRGLTVETDERVKEIGKKLKGKNSGDKNPSKKPETRKKISDSITNLWKDPIYRERLVKSMEKFWNTEEGREIRRTSAINQRQPNKNTDIEVALQIPLREMGLVFETNYLIRNIARPDIVFPEEKIAIFCDGDFWHNFPDGLEKDRIQVKKLENLGWSVFRFWGHEIKEDSDSCVKVILESIKKAHNDSYQAIGREG